MSDPVEFFVPGIPRPAGSKVGFAIVNKATGQPVYKDGRILTRVKESGKHTAAWRADVKHFAYQHYGDREPMAGPLVLSVVFYLRRPQGHYGTGRNAALLKDFAPVYPMSQPDTTKLLRAVEDALTGILWLDDAQVVTQIGLKRYGPTPGALIKVRPAGAAIGGLPLKPEPLFADQEAQ